MAKRDRLLETEDRGTRTEDGREIKSVIEVRVYYSLGGANAFTCQNEPRGYYLAVTPEEHEDSGTGYVIRRVTMFSGIKTCIQPAARFSEKTLQSFSHEDLKPKIAELRAGVLAKEEAEKARRAARALNS